MNIDFNHVKIVEIAHKINQHVKYITSLETIIDELKVELDATFLINFRDALNHYRLMCKNSNDEVKLNQQYASINEHLSRGMKDIIVYICKIIINSISYYIENHNMESFQMKNKYRKLSHKYKNLVLDIRVDSGTNIEREFVSYYKTLTDCILKTKEIFGGKIGLKKLVKNGFRKTN